MSIVEQIRQSRDCWTFPVRSMRRAPLAAFVVLLAVFSIMLVAAFAQAVDSWTWAAWAVLPLIAMNAVWISGGAATALIGLMFPKTLNEAAPANWRPREKTAILLTLCGEDPDPVATYLTSLAAALQQEGLSKNTVIFALSDTGKGADSRAEGIALATLIDAGAIIYRRRAERRDKKPGNIADWLCNHGDDFDHMIVLDADSRMSFGAIRQLIWKMETTPSLGLYQAGISLLPGRTRLGKYQRITSRLLSATFGRGFSAWAGKASNFWGHNAIIRVAAFRSAAELPTLSGPPPFGGAILSHDFIEAAWIRRAGWDVALCPNLRGSAEDAPQTFSEYFKRDRRWCQGNLQHIRLLTQPGLHPLSRFHLVCGIFSYLAAPIWLVLLGFLSSGLISVWGFKSVLSIAGVLLIPKLCALADALPPARSWARRRIILRAWGAELVLSTLLAPIMMLRQATFVVSVLLGQDCGWKNSGTQGWSLPLGWIETGLGAVLLALAIISGSTGAFWLALVIIPLLCASFLMPRLNEAAP